MAKKETTKIVDLEQSNNFPGYPIYPESEDIYAQLTEEIELDPEDPSQLKVPLEALPH